MNPKWAAGPVGPDGKNARISPGGWGSSYPLSSHTVTTGEPIGGKYLFEDAQAKWYPSREVDVGSTNPFGWLASYKIQIP